MFELKLLIQAAESQESVRHSLACFDLCLQEQQKTLFAKEDNSEVSTPPAPRFQPAVVSDRQKGTPGLGLFCECHPPFPHSNLPSVFSPSPFDSVSISLH
jgi:hypothetical protein